jgi:predicted GNAT superfamily acetyltransferase
MKTSTPRPELSDSIVYRPLHTNHDINQCIGLQKHLFKLPDTDVSSPYSLKILGHQQAIIAIGAFMRAELAGFIIGHITLREKSVYGIMIGVKEEYQCKILGYKLLLKLKESSIAQKLDAIYGKIDPLDMHLIRLYFSKLGFIGVSYEIGDYNQDTSSKHIHIPHDDILIKWKINFQPNLTKLNAPTPILSVNEALPYPVAVPGYYPSARTVLVEIPDDFREMAETDQPRALQQRLDMRAILAEYLNLRKYQLTDCLTVKAGTGRQSYYVLEEIKKMKKKPQPHRGGDNRGIAAPINLP